jgi:hypothetical protein
MWVAPVRRLSRRPEKAVRTPKHQDSVGQASRRQELVAWHRKTAIRTVCWIKHGTRSDTPKNFSLYFCLDRPQYLVVLTDHSLDALSEMR